jgi:hypothetical protein
LRFFDSNPKRALHLPANGVFTIVIARIGFRRLLPVLFTSVHLGLLLYALSLHHHTQSSLSNPLTYRSVAYQEETIQWEPAEPKPLTQPQKLAIVFNLPALLIAIPIAATLFQGSDMGLLYGSLPFVPIVWYGVGRWLDGLAGYIPRSRVLHSAVRRCFAVVSLFFLIIGIVSITPLDHHRTNDTLWPMSALILWSALFLAISLSGLRARKTNA